MSRPIRAAAAAALTLTLLVGCAAASPSDTPPASPSAAGSSVVLDDTALQTVLDESLGELAVPGIVATVVAGDQQWTGASGLAGVGASAVPTPTDRTRVGSITKTMTATILLQLVEEGALTLEDSVDTYLADIPNGTATLRQLGDMTSGIAPYTASKEFEKEFFADTSRSWTPDELLAIMRTLPISFAPGEGWEYSNSNYLLLGLIIEKVTGQPLADVFEERIFEPLGMDDSSFPTTTDLPAPALSGVSTQGSASPDAQWDATHVNPSYAFGAGEVISTVDDLQKWGHALFTGEGVLEPETQQLRRESILTSPAPNTETAGYGLGFGDRDGWWGHDGTIPGYTTSLFHSYELDVTVIVVVNSDIAAEGKPGPAPAVSAALRQALEGE